MTQRASLSDADEQKLRQSLRDYFVANSMIEKHRAVVVEMVEKSSYREVARLTGLSTNTLQRWKREAQR
jgi:uncharacterized protein YerC